MIKTNIFRDDGMIKLQTVFCFKLLNSTESTFNNFGINQLEKNCKITHNNNNNNNSRSPTVGQQRLLGKSSD